MPPTSRRRQCCAHGKGRHVSKPPRFLAGPRDPVLHRDRRSRGVMIVAPPTGLGETPKGLAARQADFRLFVLLGGDELMWTWSST